MRDIECNLKSVQGQIVAAALRAGRDPDEITLLAVSKRIDISRIEAALAFGVQALGESRVQEANAKIPEVEGNAEWHFIGPLQSNKAMLAARLFDAIHSVRRASSVSRLSASATAVDRSVQVYVQIDQSTKSLTGTQVAEVTAICRQVQEANGLELQGLMTMAPYDPNPEASRPYFANLRRLRNEIMASNTEFGRIGLSMGMSGDFEVAIEEGATIVRVGTAIFGKRDP